MSDLAPAHLLVYLLIAVLLAAPNIFILRRTGLNPWLGILLVVPFVGWLFLWVVAFVPWPAKEPGLSALD